MNTGRNDSIEVHDTTKEIIHAKSYSNESEMLENDEKLVFMKVFQGKEYTIPYNLLMSHIVSFELNQSHLD